MRTSDMLGIIDTIDAAGYYSLEVWGGATFDVCMRYLRENPWERLREIKARAKKTPLQMLLRGQNLVGYQNYADDLVDRFIALACENGIDIFRVFDALNDVRNVEHAIRCVKKHGRHAQGTICYTISPVHTVEKFVRVAKDLVEMGIDSLCIKDMAGILSPISAERLVSALVRHVGVPIQVHSHTTSGMATASYVEAVRAGAGAIDCAISVMAGFSSQPPVETMLAIFAETDYKASLDIDALRKICRYFTELALKRAPSHHPLNTIDPDILVHHIPGGMISNLRQQLEQQGALSRLPEVLEELPRVREDMGFPPLVTPTSQIVGVQAVLNVLTGKRYSMVPVETRNYVKGLYGRPPAPINPEIRRLILGKEKPVKVRPADLLPPALPTATKNVDPQLIKSEEDIISYCLFPEVAIDYFKWRALPPDQRPPSPADGERKKEEARPPASQPAPTPQPFLPPTDYQEIQKLLNQVKELGFTELVIRRNDLTLALRAGESAPIMNRQSAEAPADNARTQQKPVPAAAPVPGREASPSAAAAPSPASPPAAPKGMTINAPLNGTFYLSPQPGKPDFVKVGDKVKKSDVVCTVEAMKMFNRIEAPVDCEIVRIVAEPGKPVQKGQPLIEIRPL